MTAADPHVPAALARALGRAGIALVTEQALLAGHGVDWTGRWSGPVLGLVRPVSTEQVVTVLAAARGAGVSIQVQGGNTGLVGGSVPDRPSLVLSTAALTTLQPVDARERTVVVGAGVTVARLAAHAAAAGLHLGIDLAARDSATVGGLAATNAGGIGVLAFGMTRDQVRGLTAVLADGRIVATTGRPRKDNTGYDLTGLLIGSEGTLGVITEVEVALHPMPAASTVGILGAADLAMAVAAARAVQAGPFPLLAAEVVDAAGAQRAALALGLPQPLAPDARWLLLLEVADGATAKALESVADLVGAVATDAPSRLRLWSYRERQTELYAALPGAGPEKFDISLRLDRLDEGVAAVRSLIEGADRAAHPGADRAWVGFFGHALDGNLHAQVVNAPPGIAAPVLELVASLGGSISAEHGIGRMKSGLLGLARSADEISWMRQVRSTVDPDGLLNPGVLLPA